MKSIEGLNKTQIILLSLLVSFLVSIFTSMITFSLLAGASPQVTERLNTVVDSSIDRISPANTGSFTPQ